MPELLPRSELPEILEAPREQSSLVPPVPPEGLDTALYEHDERAARADLRRQIAVMEAELGELFSTAFPRKGIEFTVPAPGGGPRLLSVDELERVRDGLASRLVDVRGRLHDHTYVEERNRELIERMTAAPDRHKWVRVSNEDVGEPGCRHWHSRPRYGLVGMVMGWWRVKVSSGCPLAEGLRPPPRWRIRSASVAGGGEPQAYRGRPPKTIRPPPARYQWVPGPPDGSPHPGSAEKGRRRRPGARSRSRSSSSLLESSSWSRGSSSSRPAAR